MRRPSRCRIAGLALLLAAAGCEAAPSPSPSPSPSTRVDGGGAVGGDGGRGDGDVSLHPPDASAPLDSGAMPAAPGVRLTTDLGVPCGDTDVAAQINAALAGLPSGTEVWLECVYLVDYAVVVPEGLTLGKAPDVSQAGLRRLVQTTVPEDWPRGTPYFPYFAIRGSNVVVQDLVVRGPLATRGYDAALETAHAVTISGAYANITLRRLDISGVHGDVLYFGDPVVGAKPTDVLVEDVHSVINGRQSIGLSSGERLTFRRVTIEQTARSAIDIEPLFTRPSGQLRDLLFEDCAFLDYKNVGFALHANTTYRVTLRRVQFRGGIALGQMRSDDMPDATGTVEPPHEDIVFDQVTYDYHSPFPQTSDFGGTLTADGIVRLDIRDSSWRTKRAGSLNCMRGSGSVTGSTFVSDATPPAMRVGATMSESGNTGTGVCDMGP